MKKQFYRVAIDLTNKPISLVDVKAGKQTFDTFLEAKTFLVVVYKKKLKKAQLNLRNMKAFNKKDIN